MNYVYNYLYKYKYGVVYISTHIEELHDVVILALCRGSSSIVYFSYIYIHM